MLISTFLWLQLGCAAQQFQSLDWVDVDFDEKCYMHGGPSSMFQSLDWVDVDFDVFAGIAIQSPINVSIPRLG